MGNKCPKCNYELEAHVATDGKGGSPVEGDFTICFNCGEVLEFNKDLIPVICSEEHLKEDPELFMQIKIIQRKIRESK